MTATMTVDVQTTKAPSVLVVDDEPGMRMLARAFLERGGFSVVEEAEDGPQALERFHSLNPPPISSFVLLDNRMPGLTGLEVAERMLTEQPGQVIVLFSAHLTPRWRRRHAPSGSPPVCRRCRRPASRTSSGRCCSRRDHSARMPPP